jgi:hypothetical protein
LSPLVFFFLLVDDLDCAGDFGANIGVEAGDFFFESFFVLEDFDCIGDFGATTACTEGMATAGLALTLPGTALWNEYDADGQASQLDWR